LSVTFSADYLGENEAGISAFDAPPGNLAHYEPFNLPEPMTDKEIIVGLDTKYSFESFDMT
jgi:hypothetical protein